MPIFARTRSRGSEAVAGVYPNAAGAVFPSVAPGPELGRRGPATTSTATPPYGYSREPAAPSILNVTQASEPVEGVLYAGSSSCLSRSFPPVTCPPVDLMLFGSYSIDGRDFVPLLIYWQNVSLISDKTLSMYLHLQSTCDQERRKCYYCAAPVLCGPIFVH